MSKINCNGIEITLNDEIQPFKALLGCKTLDKNVYDIEGINALTFALSDAVHNSRIGGTYQSGKTYKCSITINGAKIDPVDEYSGTIRLDFRKIPYLLKNQRINYDTRHRI